MKKLLLIFGLDEQEAYITERCLQKFSQTENVKIETVKFETFVSLNGQVSEYDGVIVTNFLSLYTCLPHDKYIGNEVVKKLVKDGYSGKVFVSPAGVQLYKVDLDNKEMLGGLLGEVVEIKETYWNELKKVSELMSTQ